MRGERCADVAESRDHARTAPEPVTERRAGPVADLLRTLQGAAGNQAVVGLLSGCDGFELEETPRRSPQRPSQQPPRRGEISVAVEPSVSKAVTTKPGLSVPPFGKTKSDVAIELGSAVVDAPAPGKLDLDLQVELRSATDWGVNGGDKYDVTSATDEIVEADTYKFIAGDLMPRQDGSCLIPRRSTVWSSALTERHERYHANDIEGWLAAKGEACVEKAVQGPWTYDETDFFTRQREHVDNLVALGQEALHGALGEHMSAGRPYNQRPSEIRAYHDGKDAYTQLALGIMNHGFALKEQQEEEAAARAARGNDSSAAAAVLDQAADGSQQQQAGGSTATAPD